MDTRMGFPCPFQSVVIDSFTLKGWNLMRMKRIRESLIFAAQNDPCIAHSLNLCPHHNSFDPCCILMFLMIIVHDPRVCRGLDSRSYLKVQGHSADIPKICVWTKRITGRLDLDDTMTEWLLLCGGYLFYYSTVLVGCLLMSHSDDMNHP